MWACWYGHEGCLQLLIAAGANLKQQDDVRALFVNGSFYIILCACELKIEYWAFVSVCVWFSFIMCSSRGMSECGCGLYSSSNFFSVFPVFCGPDLSLSVLYSCSQLRCGFVLLLISPTFPRTLYYFIIPFLYHWTFWYSFPPCKH